MKWVSQLQFKDLNILIYIYLLYLEYFVLFFSIYL